jgi:exodeoxyribonuclease X
VAIYTLFDTETTGKEAEDRIIQLGAMILYGTQKVELYDALCRSEVPISIEAMEVHHITPEKLRDAPLFEALEVREKLWENNSDQNYLIAHNIAFDLEMLKREGFENAYALIDTLRCSKHLLPNLPAYRLQYLRYALGLYQHEEPEAKRIAITIKPHDALSDVLVMKLLLSHLVSLVKEKYPNTHPMEQLAHLTQTPVLLKVFGFGKYKGREIQEVIKEDRGYISWVKKSIEDEDLLFTIAHYQKS